MMRVLLNAKYVTFPYTKLFVMFHAVRPTYMNLVEVERLLITIHYYENKAKLSGFIHNA